MGWSRWLYPLLAGSSLALAGCHAITEETPTAPTAVPTRRRRGSGSRRWGSCSRRSRSFGWLSGAFRLDAPVVDLAYPDYLVRVVEEVGRQNFKLAFDLGHFLVYSEIDLPAWLTQIAPICSTVYVHSNDGLVDTHAEPFQGMLRPDQVSLLKQYLPEKTRLIAKPFNKSAISECVAWLEAALNQEVKA